MTISRSCARVMPGQTTSVWAGARRAGEAGGAMSVCAARRSERSRVFKVCMYFQIKAGHSAGQVTKSGWSRRGAADRSGVAGIGAGRPTDGSQDRATPIWGGSCAVQGRARARRQGSRRLGGRCADNEPSPPRGHDLAWRRRTTDARPYGTVESRLGLGQDQGWLA